MRMRERVTERVTITGERRGTSCGVAGGKRGLVLVRYSSSDSLDVESDSSPTRYLKCPKLLLFIRTPEDFLLLVLADRGGLGAPRLVMSGENKQVNGLDDLLAIFSSCEYLPGQCFWLYSSCELNQSKHRPSIVVLCPCPCWKKNQSRRFERMKR